MSRSTQGGCGECNGGRRIIRALIGMQSRSRAQAQFNGGDSRYCSWVSIRSSMIFGAGVERTREWWLLGESLQLINIIRAGSKPHATVSSSKLAGSSRRAIVAFGVRVKLLTMRLIWSLRERDARRWLSFGQHYAGSNVLTSQITDISDLRECWIALQNRFAPNTPAHQYELKRRLYNLRVEEGESFRDFVHKFWSVFSHLEDIGVGMDEQELVYGLLRALPPSWEDFKTVHEGQECQSKIYGDEDAEHEPNAG